MPLTLPAPSERIALADSHTTRTSPSTCMAFLCKLAFCTALLTPWAETLDVSPGQVAAALVVLGTGSLDRDAIVSLEVAPGAITVRWGDGTVDEVAAEGVAR